jgi:hypothetical protein
MSQAACKGIAITSTQALTPANTYVVYPPSCVINTDFTKST